MKDRLSHLDNLEAEAIYIIREVAAECENPVMLYSIGKGQFGDVAFGVESVLPGAASVSFFTYRYYVEISRDDYVSR